MLVLRHWLYYWKERSITFGLKFLLSVLGQIQRNDGFLVYYMSWDNINSVVI